jgi:hypothetical protein
LSVLHVEQIDVSGQPMPAESPAFWSWTSVVDPFHFSKATFTNYTEDFKGTLDYIWPLESQRVF